MERKRVFEPGDMVAAFTGQTGLVLSQELYEKARTRLKEGRRPGHYFAPGCCRNPDYVIQIPVLFEDCTYDVMRSMNIRKAREVPEEKKKKIQGIIDEIS
jgi:hypothetical protein